jgi:hypothetical protein
MGPKGTISTVRRFLAALDLGAIPNDGHEAFEGFLDRATEDLRSELVEGFQNWGPPRKFLNIFLRDALYDAHLSIAYELSRLESWLEVPLDSHVARGLTRDAIEMNLGDPDDIPTWDAVIRLTPGVSGAYQHLASRIAQRRAVARVHLDLLYWRAEVAQ